MAASNNSTNDTLLAQFYMDDYNRKAQQDKRALQAPNTTDKSDTQEKAVEKPPFDHAAFLAWAKGPVKTEEPVVNNKRIPSPSRLRTF